MAIELNKHGIKPKYNADEYIKKFIPLVIKESNEYTKFSISDLDKKLNLSEKDNIIFNDVSFEIRLYLIENGLANMYGSSKIKLTEKGRDIKNGKEKIFGVIINNNFSNSTIGQYNQSSNFSNSPQTNNITQNNNADLKTKPIIKFWKFISENKLISSIIFVIFLYLIKIIFGIDLKN